MDAVTIEEFNKPMSEALYRVGQDAKNHNCRRVHGPGGQWCKVYGWSPEIAEDRAQCIADALNRAHPEAAPVHITDAVFGSLVAIGYSLSESLSDEDKAVLHMARILMVMDLESMNSAEIAFDVVQEMKARGYRIILDPDTKAG